MFGLQRSRSFCDLVSVQPPWMPGSVWRRAPSRTSVGRFDRGSEEAALTQVGGVSWAGNSQIWQPSPEYQTQHEYQGPA